VEVLLSESFVVSIIIKLLWQYGGGAPLEIPLYGNAVEHGREHGNDEPVPRGVVNAIFDLQAGRLRLWLDGMNTQSAETETKQTEEKAHE
jgi:hypothetical protein